MSVFARRELLVSALLAALIAPPAGTAQSFPTRPIRMIVPFAAGGPTDVVARLLGEAMAGDLGQPIVIENRPGANGNVATEAVAKSPPDGYTMMYNSSHVAISPAIYPKLPYDVRQDLAPVCLTAILPLVLVVHPDIPARTAQEFVAYAKERPGKLSYGSGGVGNVTHLATALFLKLHGLEAVHVPFRGTAPALAATSGGHVQFTVDAVNTAQSLINGGQVRGLAVFGAARASVLPNVPTVDEAGLGRLEIGAWQGIMVAGGTPTAIVERLNASAVKALSNPAVKEKLAIQGAAILASTPAEYGRYIDAEIIRWTDVARGNGIKAE